jgi:hypothetical protein
LQQQKVDASLLLPARVVLNAFLVTLARQVLLLWCCGEILTMHKHENFPPVTAQRSQLIQCHKVKRGS